MESPQPYSKNSSPKKSSVDPPSQPESSQCGKKPENDNQNLHANRSSEICITNANTKNLPNNSQSSTTTGVSNVEAVSVYAATQEESNATSLASIENMEVEKLTKHQGVPPSGCHNETMTRNQSDKIADPNLVTAMSQSGPSTSDGNIANRYIPPQQEIIAADQQSNAGGQEVMEQNCEEMKTPEPTTQVKQTSTSTSYSKSLQTKTCVQTQRILRMKIVPPFRREHFQYPQLLQQDIDKAMCEILNAFQMKHRNKITISRTNLMQHGRNLQILMVTAPGEAEEDVARAKLSGLQIMGKTVFPTGDEFWRYSPSEYPKRAMIRITNLPILLSTDELEELLNLPPNTELNDLMERETVTTDAGKVHTGRARIPILIQSKSHEEQLFNWSMWRNTEAGRLEWNEIPIYMAIPRLHKCAKCEAEGRRQFVGHDELWCRIVRQSKQTPEVETQTQESGVNEAQEVAQGEATNQTEAEAEETKITGNLMTSETEDDEDSQSSEEDDNNKTTNEGEVENTGNKWQPVKKKKRKRSKESSKSKTTVRSKTEGPKRSRNYNIND